MSTLFSHKQRIQWEAESKRLGCKLKQELLADGTYIVAFKGDYSSSMQVFGLFKTGDDGGGYFSHPVSRVNSAKMILKSHKLAIKHL
jgi:hypothetical protein